MFPSHQEEESPIPTRLPPHGDGLTMFHPTRRPNVGQLGADLCQPHRPCDHVLLLFHYFGLPRIQALVQESIDDFTNQPICHRPLHRLFCLLFVLRRRIPRMADDGQLFRDRRRRSFRLCHLDFLSLLVHRLLPQDL